MAKGVALLTNFIAPYRLSLYKAMAARVENWQVLVSTPMEPNRPWPSEWGGLNVTVQKNITIRRSWQHPHGFADTLYVHIPYDTIWVLKKYQPDVIISQELGMRTLQAALYRKLNPKSRLIIWGLYSEYTEQGRGKLRYMLRRWLLPQADAVIVNGKSGARYIQQFGGTKIFTAPYSTEMSPFLSVPLAKEPNQVYRLLYVGQLIERKGLIPFLKALARWAQEHRERSIELWLLGDGPLRATLQEQVLPQNVLLRFLGNVQYAELPEIYAQGGILVFPTLADEWGVVVNEAMAAGLPILGSIYSQAVEELCVEGVTGWLFRPDRDSEIYSALDRAFSTKIETLEQMRTKVRESIQGLTPDWVADRLLEAIHYVSDRN